MLQVPVRRLPLVERLLRGLPSRELGNENRRDEAPAFRRVGLRQQPPELAEHEGAIVTVDLIEERDDVPTDAAAGDAPTSLETAEGCRGSEAVLLDDVLPCIPDAKVAALYRHVQDQLK